MWTRGKEEWRIKSGITKREHRQIYIYIYFFLFTRQRERTDNLCTNGVNSYSVILLLFPYVQSFFLLFFFFSFCLYFATQGEVYLAFYGLLDCEPSPILASFLFFFFLYKQKGKERKSERCV